MTNYTQLYLENQEFHDYVNRLMRPGKNDAGGNLEEVLKRRTVQEVGKYYLKKSRDSDSPVSPVFPNDFCSCEDKSC